MITVKLNNGVEMPRTGFGVFRLQENGPVEKAVVNAIKNGYRMIDTAYEYHNEAGVGRGIKLSGLPRDQIFITSKVGNDQQGYQSTKEAFYQTLKDLQTDYLDLYLIHWPRGKKSLETWEAMEELYEQGLIRAIGVSNFKVHHLEYLLSNSKIVPAVNQVEFHPLHWSSELHTYCRDKGIQTVAWSPLMTGKAIQLPLIKKIARKYQRTPAQIVLRWIYQKDVVTIPKSNNSKRIIENIDVFDFLLTDDDLAAIDALNNNESLVKKQDRISFLLQMLWKLKYNKTIYRLLFFALFNKVSVQFKK